MEDFVPRDSIVRRIWGKSDTILFIFSGAAAEFALNKAVDWLYFTGKLPADPLGRLFSTVNYARQIVFASEEDAFRAIDKITAIHKGVENARGSTIPDWAYRDVLYMLIHYSIAAFELLERKLTDAEHEDVYQVFYRMGIRMGLKKLPGSYETWLPIRGAHMDADLQESKFTADLFRQYRKHLGPLRYFLLLHAQKLVVPRKVAALLHFTRVSVIRIALPFYKLSRVIGLDHPFKMVLMPAAYKEQIRQLDQPPA
ncbi:MAG TPA: oxygenase MpaB family protein [Flavisolibacter sp.]|nr:oxygenase MpaB family protein [Flavisolibacter sp.]